MTAFVFSAALAFLIYQLLAFAHFPRARDSVAIRTVRVYFDDSSALWARRLFRAALVIAALIALLLVHDVAFPYDAVSRNKVAIFLGFFFGPLFAIWLNSIFAHPPGKNLTRGQIIGGFGLILLVFIGVTGNDTSVIIQRYARNLSSVKVPGAEFAFLDKRRDSAGPGALPPPGASVSFAQSNASSGLLYLSDLPDTIERDRSYLELFAPRDHRTTPLIHDMEVAEQAVKTLVAAPFGCMLQLSERKGDIRTINRQVDKFSDFFGQIHEKFGDRADALGKSFIQASLELALQVLHSGEEASIRDCSALLGQLCPVPANGQNPSCDVAALRSAAQAGRRGDLPDTFGSLLSTVTDYLKYMAAQDRIKGRPYLAHARASIMAQLGQYEAMGAILDEWVVGQASYLAERSRTDKNAGPWMADDWFQIRARSTLAAFMEEWIRKERTRPASVVLEEHLKNLQVLRNKIKEFLVREQFFSELLKYKETNDVSFIKPASCSLNQRPNDQIGLLQRLFLSYVSMELTYMQTTLRHPEYPEKYAATTAADAKRMASLDHSCIAREREPETIYAEILSVFAEVAIRNPKNAEADEPTRKRLTDAERAIQFGQETVNELATRGRQRETKSFLGRISENHAVEVQELLTRTNRDLLRVRREFGFSDR